ncbi:MAG: hypothetical protein K1Y02_00990 [Candidatus Hydrogenedentes bacterium]|nr:hypothetical protein [Candidatus Hydrogenedentota bacterium]
MNISAISDSLTSVLLSKLSGSSSSSQMRSMRGPGMDPSEMVESRATEYIETNDSDGDGYLSASEVSSLSDDAFSAADVDGDGLLSQDELISTIKDHMEQIRSLMESGTSEDNDESVQSLMDSAEGELFRAIMPPPPQGPDQAAMSAYQDNNSLLSSLLSGDNTDLANSWGLSLLNVSA